MVFYGFFYGVFGLVFYVWVRCYVFFGVSFFGVCFYMGVFYYFVDIEYWNVIGEVMVFILVLLIFCYLLDVEMWG